MRKYISALLVLTVIGCTKPIDRVYWHDNIDEDHKDIWDWRDKKESGDTVDFETLLRLRKGDYRRFEGWTYRQIISVSLKLQEEELKLALAEQSKQMQLDTAVRVKATGKDETTSEHQLYFELEFNIHNRSGKDIRALEGIITYYDLFDEQLYSVRLTCDEPIKTGTTHRCRGYWKCDKYEAADRYFRTKDLKDLKSGWEPLKILFSDGTRLE